jgi:hypothetical protein
MVGTWDMQERFNQESRRLFEFWLKEEGVVWPESEKGSGQEG